MTKEEFISLRYEDQKRFYNQHVRPYTHGLTRTWLRELNRAVNKGTKILNKDLWVFALQYRNEMLEKKFMK